MEGERVSSKKIQNFIKKTIDKLDEKPQINFYSLLFFTLVLVDRFSFEVYQLHYLARIDLTISIFDFVIDYLHQKGMINEKSRQNILKTFQEQKLQLPQLLETYLRAENNLLYFNVYKKKKSWTKRFSEFFPCL